jgi:hypothetical protein
LQQVTDVLEVLQAERVVEVEVRAQLGLDRGRERAVTGECSDRVPRQRVDHREDEEGRPDQHGDG